MTDRPNLHQLAQRVGILPEYYDICGVLHRTADQTYESLLSAMGFLASSEQAAQRSLDRLDVQVMERMLAPARVVRWSAPEARLLPVRFPLALAGQRLSWHLQLQYETGQTLSARGTVSDCAGAGSIELPSLPPMGYHRLQLTVTAKGGGERTAQGKLIVVPDRCVSVRDMLGNARVFGVIANLYSVRSGRNWGAGDLSDMCNLCRWTACNGGDFLGVNPLHTLRNAGHDVSPYSPVSRLHHNVIYLDPTVVPEFEVCTAVRELVQSNEFCCVLQALRAADRVEYEAAAALKMRVMRLLFDEFKRRARHEGAARAAALAEYCAVGGEPLRRFGLFSALEEHFSSRFGAPRHWRHWPAEYRHPESMAVRAFAEAHSLDIEFHQFLQFELDRQLGAAETTARDLGMRIGLYQDLAIGSAASGSDAWANPGLFVVGARVGAPPDDYSKAGQDWGLPPIHPLKLAEQGFEYWTQLLRASFAHSGALRIDHVMGLLRQYWVPPGATPLDGAYVRYPADELFGILALESARHRALVIGEDLGTVPQGFAQLLEQWGLLSCEVLYFQRDADQGFLSQSSYSSRSLVTTTTHDHVPIAGFLSGADLELRRSVGAIHSDEALKSERSSRRKDQQALFRRLASSGLIHTDVADGGLPDDGQSIVARNSEIVRAVYGFLAGTPAPLVGLMLDDLLGEEEPVNLPGLGAEQHASWSRRMTVPIEDLDCHPMAQAALAGVTERVEPVRCSRR